MVFAKDAVNEAAYSDDDATPTIGDNSLAVLRGLAEEQLRLEKAVEDAEAALAKARKDLADVAEVRLPDLMESNSLPEFKYAPDGDGKALKIKLNQTITGSPVCEHRARPNAPACDACRAKLYGWLKAIGEEGAIKHTVEIPVGRVPQKNIDSLMSRVRKMRKGLEPVEAKKVEPATLSSIISRRSEDGKEIDQTIVKVNRRRVAKVERK